MTNISISTPQFASNIKQPSQNSYKSKSTPADSVNKTLRKEINRAKSPDYIPSKMLLSLVKSSLSGEKIDAGAFTGRSYEDWIRMYNLGIENSVLPTILDGVRKNPDINIPDDVLKNMEINEKYVKHYHMN